MTTIGQEIGERQGATPHGPARPRYLRLVRSTLCAVVVVGAVCVVPLVLLIDLRLFPRLSSSATLKPFHVTSATTLLAEVCWTVLVAWAVGSVIVELDSYRQRPQASRGWMTIALAPVVYVSSLLHGLPLLLIVLAPVLIAVVAYRRDGQLRAWPLSRRVDAAILSAAALFVFGFGATHAFSLDSGPAMMEGHGTTLANMRWVSFDLSLENGLIPTEVKSASFVGVNDKHLIATVWQGANAYARSVTGPGPGGPVSLQAAVSTPADQQLGAPALSLPRRFGSRAEIAVSFGAGTGVRCPAGEIFTFTRVKLRYTIFGLPLSMTVPIAPATVYCPR